MAFDDRNAAGSADARSSSVDLSSSPWLVRIFDRVPLPLPAMGMAIALAHFLFLGVLFLALSPGLGEELLFRGWLSFSQMRALYIVKALLVGYLAAAAYYGLRGAVRDFEDLRPALGCSDTEFDSLLTRLRRVPRVPLYVASALALWGGFFGVQAESNWTGFEQVPPVGSASMTRAQIDGFVSLFFLYRTLTLEFISAFTFAQVARRFARIDLLDLERVAPFSRRALRAVLVLVLYGAILALQAILEFNPAGPTRDVVNTSVLAIAVFLIPLIPLQRRIHAAKQSELARIRTAIREGNEARIVGDEGWALPDAPLTHLIVYEQRIEQVNTWAFNTPTVLRFAIYVSLGVGSWLGGALVERWLGALLGS